MAVLSDDERRTLAEVLSFRLIRKRQVIFYQGDPGDELFLLIDGRVRISCESTTGREITLTVFNDGGFFGELALLDGEPRSASAIAECDSMVMVLRRIDFQNFLTDVPSAGVALLAFLSRRLRRSNKRVHDFALLTVRERLAALLVDVAKREGEPRGEGVGITLPKELSHRALAGMLATTRETVSRVCGEFKESGLMAQEGRRIVVLDIEGLEAAVGNDRYR